ncbi:hypothetical protein EHS25_000176 [Saitozyma podzolica]|uniref:Heme oxygenase n=1 Tax=Saitozyma podzolica TaxID=1890683 RepID=A0A427YVE1_9TREE|nr:hypothetical protein EHS25_000176 [Saitozyma podzolica]
MSSTLTSSQLNLTIPVLSRVAGDSTPSTPLDSPSFKPNTPPPFLPAEEVSIPAIIAALSGVPSLKDDPTVTVDDLELPEDLDFANPVSVLLREGTRRAHVQAEHSAGAAALLSGRLELEDYVRWMAVLWRVYDALELALAEHSTHPVLAAFYDPSLLSRANPIAKDILYLLTILPPFAAKDADLSSSPIPSAEPFPPFPSLRLLAHAYVRYLGDLSGGQVIGARIKKAYGLEGQDGTAFYRFDEGSAGQGEIKAETKKRMAEIKDWFRRGMDEGVGEDKALKARLVKEANLAFALNTHLFSLIRPPTESSALVTVDSTSGSLVAADVFKRPEYAGLRYFEIRELERQRKLRDEPVVPNTWRERIERFLFFVLAAGFGLLVSRYAPVLVQKVMGPQ